MEKLSKGDVFPKIVEAYSRPTRIVRGKDVDVGVEVREVSVWSNSERAPLKLAASNIEGCKNQVDESVFETSQEKELWSIYTSIKDRIHTGNATFFSIKMVGSYK